MKDLIILLIGIGIGSFLTKKAIETEELKNAIKAERHRNQFVT